MRANRAFAFVAALAACSETGPGETDIQTTTTDSAGVVIVTNAGTQPTPLADGNGLKIDLRIGVMEGDERYQFHDVLEIAVHPGTGDIVVADAGTGVMRVFDEDGQYVRTLGRRGEGPGETTRPDVLTWLGDSILAVTGANYQAVRFDGSGALVEQTPLMHETGVVYPVGRSTVGWFVWLWSSNSPFGQLRANQILADSLEIRHVNDSGARTSIEVADRDTARFVIRIPRGPRTMAVPTDRGFSSARLLWDPEAFYATGAGVLFVSRGDPYQIDSFDASGRWLRSVRRVVAQVPVSDSLTQDYERRIIAHYDTVISEYLTAMRAAGLASLNAPIPAVMPPIHRLLVSSTGAFWVERRDLAQDLVAPMLPNSEPAFGGTWDRFDREGRFVGAVRLPAEFRPFTLEADAVYGVLRDSFDVEYIARIRVGTAPQGN